MLIIIVPTLIGQLLAVYLFYQRHWYNVSQHSSNIIVTEISSLLNAVDYASMPGETHSYLNLKYKYEKDARQKFKKQKYIEELAILKKTLQKEIGQAVVVTVDDRENINVFLEIGSDLLRIQLPYKSLINPTTGIFVLWIFGLTILLLSVSLIFSKNQIRSIIELTDAAESYGRGDKSNEYKPSGAREVRRAGLAFLKMKERIERQRAKRTQMLAMISHDLKTPLTRMKLQVELMKPSEEREELQYDIESMQHMVDSYLDFSRGEGGEEFQVQDLNKWIRDLIKNKWSKSDIKINTEKEEALAQIKPHSFERAITNILGNAQKHSTKIEISIYSERSEVYITIEDNGSGIKREERSKVFKPFYRADKSRSLDNHAGVGLGLAITKEIINGHFGAITLGEGKALKGLMVKIQLPRKTKK